MNNNFLVRRDKEYVDLSNGATYKPFTLVPYEQAKHGLCEEFGKPILKKVIDDSFNPLIFIAKKNPKTLPKRIRTQYVDANKLRKWWLFEPYEVAELKRGLDEGLNEGQIAKRIFAPEEAVEKATFKLVNSLKELKRNRMKRAVKKRGKTKKKSKITKVVKERKVRTKKIVVREEKEV